MPMNIDGATAIIYRELGFPPAPDRGLFVLSRSVADPRPFVGGEVGGARIKGPLPRPLLAAYDGPPRDFDG